MFIFCHYDDIFIKEIGDNLLQIMTYTHYIYIYMPLFFSWTLIFQEHF